jgi:hypothetical protein
MCVDHPAFAIMAFRSTEAEGSGRNVRGCPEGELDGDEFNDEIDYPGHS